MTPERHRGSGQRGGAAGRLPFGPGADRAVSAVVGKALEAGIVVLYVSVLATTLYGGVVPEYESAAGEELGERVLAEAAVEIQTAVPEHPHTEATVHHELPRALDGVNYRVVAENDTLHLRHPDDSIGGSVPLALPSDVERATGTWHSHERGTVQVRRTGSGRVVELSSGGASEAAEGPSGVANAATAAGTGRAAEVRAP